MSKVFLHSFFSFMLIWLIFANIIYAFSMSGVAIQSWGMRTDLTNNYIGFSQFIDFMNTNDSFGNIVKNMEITVNKFNSWLISIFNGQIWVGQSFTVLDFIFRFFTYLITPILLIANILAYVAYGFMLGFSVVIKVFNFLGGAYSTPVWEYTYAVTTPLAQSIKSFI